MNTQNNTQNNTQKHTQSHKKQQGFTLIEILIVIAIISTLLVAAVTSFGDKPGEARTATAKISLKNIATALKVYRLDNITYPKTGELNKLVPKYLDKLEKDPWGEDYKYISDGTSFQLYTYGADKSAGGEGENQDVKVPH
jgi:general secretion pathway protein G